MIRILVAVGLGAALAAGCTSVERPAPRPGEHTLWYDSPADLDTGWTSALPVGNGRLGAMVYGGTVTERLQLNEDTVWAGPPVPVQPDTAGAGLAEARRLFLSGKPAEGEAVVRASVMAPRISPRSYQTLGDLLIRLDIAGFTLAEP